MKEYTVFDMHVILGIAESTVRQHAKRYHIGRRIGKRVLIFSETDRRFFEKRPGPGNPNWVKKAKK